MFSDSRDPMITFSDPRDPIFNSRDPNRVPKTPLKKLIELKIGSQKSDKITVSAGP